MREILFRGKRKENGKWIYGSLVPKEINSYADGFLIIDGAFNYDELDYYQPSFSTYDVVSETIGQYTGFTDKNGNKIFEGDIVQGAWETIFAVYYNSNYLQFRAKVKNDYTREIDYYGNSTQIEVVGNIYDNPELLKEA